LRAKSKWIEAATPSASRAQNRRSPPQGRYEALCLRIDGESRDGPDPAAGASINAPVSEQHLLNFLPLPQGQGSLRPTLALRPCADAE
jgi:hypothetical protein